MQRRLSSFLSSLLAVIVIVLVYGFNSGALEPSKAPKTVSSDPAPIVVDPAPTPVTSSTVETNALVVRVVDGDTILAKLDASGKEEKIRMLGINTPESVDPRKPVECFGKEASTHLRTMIEGTRVRLEEDPKADERDKYLRLLRNVIGADGTDINLTLVQAGYAQALLDYPLNPVRKQQLKAAEQDAKLASRGLWSPETCNGQK